MDRPDLAQRPEVEQAWSKIRLIKWVRAVCHFRENEGFLFLNVALVVTVTSSWARKPHDWTLKVVAHLWLEIDLKRSMVIAKTRTTLKVLPATTTVSTYPTGRGAKQIVYGPCGDSELISPNWTKWPFGFLWYRNPFNCTSSCNRSKLAKKWSFVNDLVDDVDLVLNFFNFYVFGQQMTWWRARTKRCANAWLHWRRRSLTRMTRSSVCDRRWQMFSGASIKSKRSEVIFQCLDPSPEVE